MHDPLRIGSGEAGHDLAASAVAPISSNGPCAPNNACSVRPWTIPGS